MNSRHKTTLISVFNERSKVNIAWKDIESLFKAIGCQCIEGRGSRVRFVYGGHVASFHRPHPQKEARPYQVRDARLFLRQIGVTP